MTPDSLKIRFFVQIDFFAAHGGQGGVNGGSEGTKDLLAWSPNNAVRFGVFTVPSFVNIFFVNMYDITKVPHDITG